MSQQGMRTFSTEFKVAVVVWAPRGSLWRRFRTNEDQAQAALRMASGLSRACAAGLNRKREGAAAAPVRRCAGYACSGSPSGRGASADCRVERKIGKQEMGIFAFFREALWLIEDGPHGGLARRHLRGH